MNFQVKISTVNMRYDKDGELLGANVNFNGNDPDKTIVFNGYNVPLTKEQYQGNESLDKLEEVIRQVISEKVIGA